AQSYNDKRLLEPLLQVMGFNKDLDLIVLQALKFYKDPRVVERALPYLGKTRENRRYYHDPVVIVLVHQLGQDFGPFMVKQFQEARDETARVEAAYVLGDFVGHSQVHWSYPPAKRGGDQEDRKKSDELRREALRQLVEAARE